jgi:hypothetical protein
LNENIEISQSQPPLSERLAETLKDVKDEHGESAPVEMALEQIMEFEEYFAKTIQTAQHYVKRTKNLIKMNERNIDSAESMDIKFADERNRFEMIIVEQKDLLKEK